MLKPHQAVIVGVGCALMLMVFAAIRMSEFEHRKVKPEIWLTYDVDTAAAYAGAPPGAEQMTETARNVVEQRLAVYRFGPVLARGHQLVLGVPTLDPLAIADLKRLVEERGSVELRLVDESADIFAKVPDANFPSRVWTAPDNWNGGTGAPTSAPYAWTTCGPAGDAGETPDACLARLEAWTRTLPVPTARRLAYERMTTTTPTAADVEPGWRTYVLVDPPVITNEGIADAAVAQDTTVEGKKTYYVGVTLTASAAADFEAFTGANVGRRMAIVLNGVVDSVPVIKSKIAGGRVSITVGGPPETQLAAAKRLEIVLRHRALPAPLHLASVDNVTPVGR